MMWPKFCTKDSDFPAGGLGAYKGKQPGHSEGNQCNPPWVPEECPVYECWEDHIDVETCCDMESTYVLDLQEEQFHV
jgi:hypothetical protein